MYDMKEIEEITSIKVLITYINNKYLSNTSLLNDSLKCIRDAKDPLSKGVSISNIQICINTYERMKSVKLDRKIETQHLALFEQTRLLEERRSKYLRKKP